MKANLQVVGSMFGIIWSHIILSSAAIVKPHPTPIGPGVKFTFKRLVAS